MISFAKNLIVNWLIQHDAIEENDRELYEYAIYSLIMTLSPFILTLIIGSYMDMLKESFMIILPFMILRRFSGGYHAKHLYSCLIGSCCILVICIKAAALIKCGIGLSIITICAIFSLIMLSPIDHENRRLNAYEKTHYKHITIIIAILFGMVYFLLYIFQIDSYAVCISVGLLLSAALQIPCFFVL